MAGKHRSKNRNGPALVRVSASIPTALHAHLSDSALANRRSLSEEILARLMPPEPPRGITFADTLNDDYEDITIDWLTETAGELWNSAGSISGVEAVGHPADATQPQSPSVAQPVSPLDTHPGHQ